LEAEHAEREAALGRSGDEIRERMRAVETRLRDLRNEVERLHEDDKRAATRLQAAEEALREGETALASATTERDAALGALRRLGPAGVLELALGQHAPRDLAQSSGWSLTRALEVLRAVPEEALRVRSGLLRLANGVQERAGELDRALGQQAEMSVVTEQTEEGVLLVKVREGAAERSVSDLAARLDAEIADRERTLTAEQRRVFGDALLEEIAEHLRGRIDRVEALVADMNATLGSCPTGSGKTVQLEWRPRDEDGGELRRVVRLLRRSMATLAEDDRARLVAFFRARVQHARDEAALAVDSGAGAATHLLEAFDYRDWHEFGLFECREGRRERLTRRRHALGSGGEQAVLIHMPLFAAAAALYSSSVDGRAPRLVMLDEALSGIDDETRAKVMGVLVALDLDFVLTSHELWGTYRTVPQLSIYQLHRENGVFGVASERFLWDGELLHELEQGSLTQ
ncbi:MAG: SbcC/MukB-like Walker B domain-containing protein, partial [Candidatus Limnocylindria bacterium]